jgi:hypothetical protein
MRRLNLGLAEPDALPDAEAGHVEAGLPEQELITAGRQFLSALGGIDTFLSEPSKIAAYVGR